MSQPKKPPTFVGFRDRGDVLQFDYQPSDPAVKGLWTTTVQNGVADCSCVGFVNHQRCHHCEDALGRAEQHRLSKEPAAPLSMAPAAVGSRGVSRRNRAMMIPEPHELTGMIKLSSALAMGAGFAIPATFDSGPKVFAAAFKAWELDVPVMTMLGHSFIVNGKLEFDAQLMCGLIQREIPGARWDWIVEPSETQGAHVLLIVNDIKRSEGRWTPADADRAGQLRMPRRKKVEFWEVNAQGKNVPHFATEKNADGKDVPVYEDVPGNWQLWPTRMYAWAVVKIAARLGAADVINGLTALNVGSDLVVEQPPAAIAEYTQVRDEFAEDPFARATAEASEQEAPPPSPEPPPQAEPTAYPWLPPLQAIRTRDFGAIEDRAIAAVVGAETAEDMLAAIDRWIFQDGPAADLQGRARELMKAASKWQLDRIEAEATAKRTPVPAGARSMAEAQKAWADDDFEGR